MSDVESQACSCKPWCGLPPCRECNDDHGGIDGLCRDCWQEWKTLSMLCSGCERMRYDSTVIGPVWGDPCACDPRPPSTWDVERNPTQGEGRG